MKKSIVWVTKNMKNTKKENAILFTASPNSTLRFFSAQLIVLRYSRTFTVVGRKEDHDEDSAFTFLLQKWSNIYQEICNKL